MGVSLATARPILSVISASPGPEVAVKAGTPPKAAPMIMLIAASSSSACTSSPPHRSRAPAIHSSTSDAGVMG